jgi:hypothetical protein
MNWNLVNWVNRIYCGEDTAASRLLCKIGNMPDRILIGDGAGVQCTFSRYRLSSRRLLEKEGFLRDEVES